MVLLQVLRTSHRTSFNWALHFHSLGLWISESANVSGSLCLLEKKPKKCARRRKEMRCGSLFVFPPWYFLLTGFRYNLDASETFLSNLLHHCYETPIEDLSPRRLALLLMILSIGSLVDLNKPLGNLYGEAYHHLARAAVCEIPLMEEPDFDTLHALVCFVSLSEFERFTDNSLSSSWYGIILYFQTTRKL